MSQDLKKKGFIFPLKLSHIIKEETSKVIDTYGLLDTGASISLVDFEIIKELRLERLAGRPHEVITPGGCKRVLSCPLKITFPCLDKTINSLISFIPNESLILGKSHFIIGRDILQYFAFYWNGLEGKANIDKIEFPQM